MWWADCYWGLVGWYQSGDIETEDDGAVVVVE